MTPADHLAFEGIEQPISEWALDYGIPAKLIIARLLAGQNITAAITVPMEAEPGERLKRRFHTTRGKQIKPKAQPRLYQFEGQALTANEWAERLGVSASMIYQRIRRHGSVAPTTYERSSRRYDHNGHSLTLAEWSDRLGMDASALRGRLKSGHPPAVVFSPDRPPNHQAKMATLNGETLSLMDWSRRLKLSRSTITNRLKAGLTMEEALTRPVRGAARLNLPTDALTASKGPGVPSDLDPMMGTGAGSTARETPNLTFPEKAEA